MLGATALADWWPDRIADPRLEDRTADRWFNTAAFVLPQNADGTYRFGNAGRGIVNGDGLFNIDAGLMKNFRLTERFGMQFRWETFNVTNTNRFNAVNLDLGNTGAFGRFTTSLSAPRQMQFVARYEF